MLFVSVPAGGNAAPGPLLRPFHQAGPQGVSLHIANHQRRVPGTLRSVLAPHRPQGEGELEVWPTGIQAETPVELTRDQSEAAAGAVKSGATELGSVLIWLVALAFRPAPT